MLLPSEGRLSPPGRCPLGQGWPLVVREVRKAGAWAQVLTGSCLTTFCSGYIESRPI